MNDTDMNDIELQDAFEGAADIDALSEHDASDALLNHPINTLRNTITAGAGDTLSLLGTTSDTATLALIATIAHNVALAEAEDFASYKAAYLKQLEAISPETSVIEASQSFMAGLAAGQIRLPLMAKGLGAVIEDVVQRGAAVFNALVTHYQPEDG